MSLIDTDTSLAEIWLHNEKIAPNICVAFLLRLDESANQKQKQMELLFKF